MTEAACRAGAFVRYNSFVTIMAIRWTARVLLAAAALAGCQAPEPVDDLGTTSVPLLGGDVDTADSAVVALERGNGDLLCTGTLISPTVVLTAAHCMDMAGSDPGLLVFFGSDIHSDGVAIGVKRAQQQPDWTGDIYHNDVAVVLMNYPQRDIQPAQLSTTPATDLIGSDYRVVGFGVNDQVNQTVDGKKRSGMVAIADAPTDKDDIIFDDSNTIVCFGDSGGPGFVSDGTQEYVAGVHSWTSGSKCGAPNGDARVDLFVDDFIKPWIAANDPACGHDYLCVRFGCDADPDCEPCGADGTCTSGCALPDPDCPTSDLGEICQTDTQCKSGLCVYWRGDPNTKFCSQPCTAGACPSGMSCQDVPPEGNICYYDDPPAGVLGDDCTTATDCGSYVCDQGQCVVSCDLSVGKGCPADFECSMGDTGYYCFGIASDAPGGCCGTGENPGPGALLALAVALLLVPRRRR